VVKLGSPFLEDGPDDGQRKRYSAEFKAKVALEALRGELTTAQLATKHGVHQTMISEWIRQAVDGLSSVFSGRQKRRKSPGKERWRSCTRKSGSWCPQSHELRTLV
jgi:transposase-like protein